MRIKLGELRVLVNEASVPWDRRISDEVAFIRSFVDRHSDLFEAAFIVGSWAMQDPNRPPDRRGPNTSDIDLMLVPVTRSPDAWDAAVGLERAWKGRFKRPLQLNVDEVIGDAKRVQVWP
jgi:hypothetical protein